MTESLDQASLISSLKRLVIGFGPFIQNAGSYEQAEESLLHMEASDENFHRYEFVRWLRSQIDGELGPLIDREMNKHSITPQEAIAGHETVIDTITRKIIKSQDFATMTQQLKMDVTDACEYLVTNFPQEFTGEDHRSIQLQIQQDQRCDPANSVSDIESSLGESSLNQSTFMFMNNEQFQKIAQELSKKQPIVVRKEALQQLHQTPTLDALHCDWWGHLRQGLLDSLTENDHSLWISALRFIAKGFSSNSPSTKEIYTTLVEYLRMQFNISNKENIPQLEDGLDCTKPDNEKLLKAFRLMSEFQQQVSQYWLRYPDRFVEEVLESTLLLLSAHYSTASGSPAQVTPIHLLALFDTKANWFIKWTHGNYSRQPLLNVMKRHKAFLEDAVRSVVAFMKNKWSAGSKKYESPRSNTSGVHEQKTQYTCSELDYIHFIHSLQVISRTLCYCQGRDLFPIKVKNSEEPITVTAIVIIMLKLLTAPNPTTSYKLPAVQYDPGILVTTVLKMLCMTESSCRCCLCVDGVIDVLLNPVSDIINGKQNSNIGETTLLQIADILSAMASSLVGRQHLLCGKILSGSSQSSAVHILAEFTKLGMLDQFSASVKVTKIVLGHFAYVCRQLYTTCEGLMMLTPYELHDCIAQAWIVAGQEADAANTPTPSTEGQLSPGRDSQQLIMWEDRLRDTLLNFAGTPRGVLLLREKGALVDCIYYLYSRQAQRLQVSKYEKYGYGYMISQVSATAPGMSALSNSGFVMSLVRAIWSTVEIVSDQPLQVVHRSRCWPVGHDKITVKHFNNMISLMSSFCGVHEILCGKKLPTRDEYSFREFPVCVPGLLDRLVFVDSDAKIHSLFNYEESHMFGLRLLSVLTTCLDTMLLLQTQYNFQDVLLVAQKVNCTEDNQTIIIDMLSLERNYILVKTWLIGGPSERSLPSRDLENKKGDTISKPLFASYPVPKDYAPSMSLKPALKQETDLSKYLSETKKSEKNQAWLEKCKKAFCSTLTTKLDHAKGSVLQELLEKCVKVLTAKETGNTLPMSEFSGNDSLVKNFKLSAIQEEGIKVTLRYGQHLNIIKDQKDTKERLVFLMKQTSYFLKQQQRNPSPAQLHALKDGYPGYDWFVATVFLMMDGNSDKVWKFLHQFSAMVTSAYLWRQRLHCSIHQPENLALSGIPPVLYTTCHNIELILQTDVTHVHSAFKMSGFAPAQICQQWLNQCFWNYLDWIEICHYVSVCLLLGVDYQVYICVAILRFLQTDILRHMQRQNLITFLKEQPIRGFRVGEHLEYMQQLEKKFRSTILPDMMDLKKP